MSTSYHPRPGSLADRVIKYLHTNPKVELTRATVADFFNVSATSVFANLETAIKAGAIEQTRNDELEYVYRLPGKRPTGAVPPAPEAPAPELTKPTLPAVPAARTSKRRVITQADIDAIQIDDTVPLPRQGTTAGVNKWEPLLAKLTKPGQSAPVPVDWKIPLASEATKRNKKAKEDKQGPTYKVGMDQDGVRARIWRTA